MPEFAIEYKARVISLRNRGATFAKSKLLPHGESNSMPLQSKRTRSLPDRPGLNTTREMESSDHRVSIHNIHILTS
jgi:hypothetical protein